MNPCTPRCQSFGKCSGTCWVKDLYEQGLRIDEEMKTPEYQVILEGTIPCINLLPLRSTEQEFYWRQKAIGEMF